MFKKSLSTYLVLVVILSGVIDIVWFLGGEAATESGISYLLMFMPAIAALITKLIYFRKQPVIGVKKCEYIYILESIILPLIYIGIPYGIYWIVEPGSFSGTLETLGDTPAISIVIMTVISLITAFGEEVGWRGFLLNQLSEGYGKKKAIILNGVIWAVWHWPIIFAGFYISGISLWYCVPVITIDFMLMTVIMSVLRFESDSVWPAVTLHGFHNLFDQVIFISLTKADFSNPYLTGEAGIITIVMLAIITLFLVKKQGKCLVEK